MSTFTPPVIPAAMSTELHAAHRGAALRNRLADAIALAGTRWTWSGFNNPQYVGEAHTAYVYATADGTRYAIRLLDTQGTGDELVTVPVNGPRHAVRRAHVLADLPVPTGARLEVSRLGALIVVVDAVTLSYEVADYARQVNAGHVVLLPTGAAWLAANVATAPLEVQE